MRTPTGEECPFYYEDFHRGRDKQECRAAKHQASAAWQADDCSRCTLPKIRRANASPNLALEIEIKRGFWGFGKKVKVHAACSLHHIPLPNPQIGCPQCRADNENLGLFIQALENSDD